MAIELARLVTMNAGLLKELPLEEVLAIHPLLNIRDLTFKKARKVKPIKARPINTILDKSESEQSVWDKLLLVTLEGTQVLQRNSFICWGVNNDVWQQTGAKLHAKYRPTVTNEDGWTTYDPKEGSDSIMNAAVVSGNEVTLGPYQGFSVSNPQWGDRRVKDGQILNLHYGVEGDCVMQMPSDLADIYRISKGFFEATYEWE